MNIFKKSEKQDEAEARFLIILARLFFLGLIFFELLNVLRILELNTQFTWLGLLITSIFGLIVLEVTAYRYRLKKGHPLHWSVWIIITVALWLDASGDFFHLYAKFNWWDQFVHYGVSAIMTFTLFAVVNAFWVDKFCYSLLFTEGRLRLALYLASASTMSLGALYEIEEYLEDVLFHTNRLGPGADTANDLTMNFLGVLTTVAIVSAHYFLTHKRKIID